MNVIGEPETNFRDTLADQKRRQPAGVVITCDRCNEPFDEKDHVPTILPDCAHTVCSLCIYDIIDNSPERNCPICNQEIMDISRPEKFKANFKLLSILSMTNQSGQSIV